MAGGVTCGPSPGTGSLSLSLSLDMRVFIVSETSKSARYVLGRYSDEYLGASSADSVECLSKFNLIAQSLCSVM